MTENPGIREALQPYVPPQALDYCVDLWHRDPFQFKLRKSRVTKVGDFICSPGKTPRITVNSDLHEFAFLITYIHEVAHLVVHRAVGHRAEAHGNEWKKAFQDLMAPVLSEEIFPGPLLRILRQHMINPMASSFSDSRLTAELRKYDHQQARVTILSQLAEGSIFGLHGRWFRKGKLKRTRVLCREVNSKRNYLVPADAPVESAQLNLLF